MAKDLKAQFTQKIQACFEDYQASWQKLQPQELIASAGEIHAIQQLAGKLPGFASKADMAYLIQFKNPLEVAADAWSNNTGYVLPDDELEHVLWELRDRGDAEFDYEMEPEFYGGDTQNLSM